MDIMKTDQENSAALCSRTRPYINMSVAEQQCNEDEALQNAIGEFNLKRMAINNEAAKEDRSEELIEQYNKELRRDLRQSDAERAHGGVSGGKERV